MKKKLLAISLAAASFSAFSADYYVVVPVLGKTAPVQAISVALNAYSLPTAIVGANYSFDLKSVLLVTGDSTYDPSGVTWTTLASSLPTGLTLSAQGVIQGTPSAVSQGTVTAQASYKSVSAQQTYQVASYFTNFTVSSCATTSNDQFGPTTSDCQATYASYPAFADPSVFSIGTGTANKGYQYWTVPVSGQYELTLAGAQGGNGMAYSTFKRGGYGAVVRTTLTLAKGTVLTFVIGKQPRNNTTNKSAGGGGGSFIYQGTTLLLAAGGGGGGATTEGQDSSITAAGTSGAGGLPNGSFGAGGAGVSSNGTSIAGKASGGLSFAAGFSGGKTLDATYGAGQGHGGFGGGGGACACSTGNGGNGGGYSGGSGKAFPAAPYDYGGGAAGTSFLGGAGLFTGAQNTGNGWAQVRAQ